MQDKLSFDKDFIVYIPLYNSEKYILEVIDNIPKKIWQIANILVVDDQSTDESLKKVVKANNKNRWPKRVNVIQTTENRGYAGSQKLAYKIALNAGNIKSIAMLHGDGQYDPVLLNLFIPYLNSNEDIVCGYRSKRYYGFIKEETPIITWAVIRVLSIFESIITGYWRNEWHSGFVMYKTKFLSRVNIDNLTDTMHIDGHLHYAAGSMKKTVKDIAIYKRYRNYNQLKGITRFKYVLNVFNLMFKFKYIDLIKDAKKDNKKIPKFNIKS